MRTLPLRLAPIDGESLPGYVARYSHTFRFPPGDVLRALGLDGGSGIVLAAGRYGAWLPPTSSSVSRSRPASTPRRSSGCCSRGSPAARSSSHRGAGRGARGRRPGHEVLIRCSRFCPHCLRENGAWLLGWQLGWSFVCVAHRVLLPPLPELRHGTQGRSCATAGPATATASVRSDPLCASLTAHCAAASSRAPYADRRRRRLAGATPDQRAARRRVRPDLAGVRARPAGLPARPAHAVQPPAPARAAARRTRPGQRRLGRRLHDHPEELAAVLPEALALADLPVPTRSPRRCASSPTSATATTG